MSECYNCGYMWADCDEDGVPITREYCHYDGPSAWAPCEQNDYYDNLHAEEMSYKEEIDAYVEWVEHLQENLDRQEYGAPYDYYKD